MKPIIFFQFKQVSQHTKQFRSLERSHYFHGFSLWSPDMPTAAILRWPAHHNGHRQDDCNCRLFAISHHIKSNSRLCNINQWWKQNRSHIAARFGCSFVCHLTYLTTSSQGKLQFELPYRGKLQQPGENRTWNRTRKMITYKTPNRNAKWYKPILV